MEEYDYNMAHGEAPHYDVEADLKVKREGTAIGIASIVCGTVAVMTFLMIVNIPFAIAAILLGAMQIAGYQSKLSGIIGILLGITSFALSIAGWVIIISSIAA